MADTEVTGGESDREKRLRRRTGENRVRLILAGIRCFSETGFQATSTSEVASIAEVPQPHVYANFATKQDLFMGCLEAVIELLDSLHSHRAGVRSGPGETGTVHTDDPANGSASVDAGSNDLLTYVVHTVPSLAPEYEHLTRFVYHAVASCRLFGRIDPSLSEALVSRLQELIVKIGEPAFEKALLVAADELLGAPEPARRSFLDHS